MRVGIDASPVVGDLGGVGVVTHHLLKGLLTLNEPLDLVAYVPPGALRRGCLEGWPASPRLRWVEAGRWQMAARGKTDGLDLFHGTNFKMRTAGRYGGVVTLHDLWLDRHPEYSTKWLGQSLSSFRTRRTAWRAKRVITVSEHAAGEIQSLYGIPRSRLSVIHNGVTPVFLTLPGSDRMQAVRDQLQLADRPYILFVGGADPRKNHRTVVRAFARRRYEWKDHLLVLVGDAEHRFGSYRRSVQAEHIEEAVRCPGRVSSEDLHALYAGASVFVFPSLYEGFGMPVLEAMASGAPVVTSNTTALPEVAGDAALLVNPESPDELGEAVTRILQDEPLRRSLQAKGKERVKQFTWDRTARQTFGVYREIVGQG